MAASKLGLHHFLCNAPFTPKHVTTTSNKSSLRHDFFQDVVGTWRKSEIAAIATYRLRSYHASAASKRSIVRKRYVQTIPSTFLKLTSTHVVTRTLRPIGPHYVTTTLPVRLTGAHHATTTFVPGQAHVLSVLRIPHYALGVISRVLDGEQHSYNIEN